MPKQDEHELIGFWINEIDMYMRENDYQRDFFESLRDWFESKAFLTPEQKKALEKIYERVTR